MECNRDEAVRARDIAEQKYASQDFVGAKKFVLKAQQLFPGLEGLSQMLPVMEIHSVAQCKLGGTEMDWYGILQVETTADDGTIKKQYRRLALLLHPDKNKAVGAEAAFKLIGEAWGILSDKSKRALHDMRRIQKSKPSTARVAAEPNGPSFPPSFHAQPTTVPNHASSQNPNSTFWTSCPRCKMQYQYLRTYENYQLQCPKCKEVFMARDINSPTGNGAYPWSSFPEPHRQDFSHFTKTMGPNTFNGGGTATAANGFNTVNGAGLGPFPSTYGTKGGPPSGFFSPAAAAAAAQSKVAAAAAAAAASAASTGVPSNNLAADVVQQTYAKVKRERVEAEKETKRKEKEMRRKEKEDQRKEKLEVKKQEAEKLAQAKKAMARLVAKRNENIIKSENLRKLDKPVRKLKRKRRKGSEHGEEDEAEQEDPVLQDDVSSPRVATRRSSRRKKSVTSYKVDDSDSDPDLQDFPSAKRNRFEGGTGSREKSGEDNEGVPVHSENGGTDKSMADGDSDDENWATAMNGRERNKEGYGSSKIEPDRVESSMLGEDAGRDSKFFESSRSNPKSLKSEALRDEKSPSKSPRSRRGRITHSQDKEVDAEQHLESSPSVSADSQFSEKENEEQDCEDEEEERIDVPDPDFHNFDASRTERDIAMGQIWAIYDDQDGMPRFYGRISRVNIAPFKVHMQWLELSPISERNMSWAKSSGLSNACGEFKLGKSTVIEQINIFSHIMLLKAGKGLVKIHPRREEVWAIFRDCNPEERSGPPKIRKSQGDGHTYRYEMVQILDDFTEERGVKAAMLVKVSGFKTLFRRLDGVEEIRVFKPSELPKFSHSIPVEKLALDTARSLGLPPDKTLELDPASAPLDLINGHTDQSR